MAVVKTEVRNQIVSTASQIFSRFGFKKTTMDEIAQAMRKGKSSIYYYFTSKEEIFEAVVEHEAGLLRSEIKRALENSGIPQDKLRSYVLTRMKGFQKLSNIHEALKSDYLLNLDFIHRMREKYDNEEIALVKDILQSGVNKGVFRVENCHIAAIAIITAMKGLEKPLLWSKETTDLEFQLDNVLNVLLYGIVKHS
jgi:AcrR family transcriptional regulator